MSVNNLTVALTNQGNYKEGEFLFREVLKLQEMISGKQHPDTALTLGNLAVVLE
jgi:Tetratricopeptide repeat